MIRMQASRGDKCDRLEPIIHLWMNDDTKRKVL